MASNNGTQDESSSNTNDLPSLPRVVIGNTFPKGYVQVPDKDCLFEDGQRQIDMVLVYSVDTVDNYSEDVKQLQRKMFEESLKLRNLELEYSDQPNMFGDNIRIVKVHIPQSSVKQLAAIMGINPPIIKVYKDKMLSTASDTIEFLRRIQKQEKYDYTPAQRSLIVWQIMLRAKFSDSGKVGIKRLLADNTYSAAFPLHEGKYNIDNPDGTHSVRRMLYTDWAHIKCWRKNQPLWYIKQYFGDKIGLYFAWLGFYTYMLILPSIVGTICFLYGLISMGFDSPDYVPSKEICNATGMGNTTLCPLCNDVCNFIMLKDSCTYATFTYLFDNPATVAFSIFMAFWATIFLEMWKRYHSVIVWEWELFTVDEDEDLRPEFESSVKNKRINLVTNKEELYLPLWSKAWRMFTAISMVLFMLSVVIGAILGTIIYRISVMSVLYSSYSSEDDYIRQNIKVVSSVTAAMINFIVIIILTRLYQILANWLTNLENPRTEIEFEDSYTFKIFVFQFINYYSSLIYIAFFKGRFYSYPSDENLHGSLITSIKIDVCDPAGCLSELFIQLATIMLAKLVLSNIVEIGIPIATNWWRKWRQLKVQLNTESIQWEADFKLQDAQNLPLFQEYLEMVIQYGFVTLFVASFPLAPLFALLNNVIEIRLDAYKMVTQVRRPLAERAKDIGAWYGILQGITYMAVATNAFVIAYTSEFIPRLVYKFEYSENFSLDGYINHTLSAFNTSHYAIKPKPMNGIIPEICYYRGYRNGPEHEQKYDLSSEFWYINGLRLAFVVIFEHIVFALTGVLAYAIPDVPGDIKIIMQRERLIADRDKFNYKDDSRKKSMSNEDDEKVVNKFSKGQGYRETKSVPNMAVRKQDNQSSQRQTNQGSKSIAFMARPEQVKKVT